MATLLLASAGAAIGGSFGGTLFGLSGAVIGRAVGATVGRAIDQRLLGRGSKAIETGKVDRFRLSGASEGSPIGIVWGRMRIPGQVIWASRFLEQTTTSGGGKGAPSQPKVTEYSYSVSLALALCEGAIARVGRIWADGVEVSRDDLTIRVHLGTDAQAPDPKIEAIEGTGEAPAYRGIAYVVIEDLELSPFGNRVPQFTFEVIRPAQGAGIDDVADLSRGVQGVALIPGTGEYSLATTPVHYSMAPGVNTSANVHAPGGGTDFSCAVRALEEELPNCETVSLVVSWFGDDLRCGDCTIRPKVEFTAQDGVGMPWRSGGITRGQAQAVVQLQGRPAYGGTPADQAIIEAIRDLRGRGKAVVYYPFILMEQLAGNGLPDPWGANEQAAFPWRGRITSRIAPGRSGTTNGTAAVRAEVANFLGSAQSGHYSVNGGAVSYFGPAEWSYRRFILHQAVLCAEAGGVSAFCIGSELRGLTGLSDDTGTFVAVEAMRTLAADVRAILGPGCKIGYAADWSEYASVQDGQGGIYFHLDPLWADPNIDFIGIDYYVPLADWRDNQSHLDKSAGSTHSLGYLRGNVEGGEGYDWYYASQDERDSQRRTAITDGAYGEPWVWRYKDLRNWWSNPHHNRPGGVRSAAPTAWVPQSKPIWLTEFGCPAIDKGANEPNKFIDPKSSESVLPHYSSGGRDDLIQMQYLRAVIDHWSDPAKNPVSPVYGAQMVDLSRSCVWAWDARPFPQFPRALGVWSDGSNYALGHWLSGRASSQPLSSVVAEICARSGMVNVDTSQLYGLVRGYHVSGVGDARSALQPLMLAFGFDAVETDGKLFFRMRQADPTASVDVGTLALREDGEGGVVLQRSAQEEVPGRVRLTAVDAEGDYEVSVTEAIHPDAAFAEVSEADIPLALAVEDAREITARWLGEVRSARETATLALPPSQSGLSPGDIIEVSSGATQTVCRIDRIERMGAIAVEATRVSSVLSRSALVQAIRAPTPSFAPALPVAAVFMDLPLLTGNEVPHAPWLAVGAVPWTGSAAIYASDRDSNYALDRTFSRPAVMGTTETALAPASGGVWDRSPPLRVKLMAGAFASVMPDEVLNGANAIAIGDGSTDRWEILQFQRADLVAPLTWELSHRLRGQAGTEAMAAGGWPAGSIVVLLDGAVGQTGLSLGARTLDRHYRVGPARKPPSDASYTHRVARFDGVGLRPLSPVHVRAMSVGGDTNFQWVRRTRIGGDGWSATDVPLGENTERYQIEIRSGATIVRSVQVSVPDWTYAASDRTIDGVVAPYEFSVAQISDVFGPGIFTRITVNE